MKKRPLVKDPIFIAIVAITVTSGVLMMSVAFRDGIETTNPSVVAEAKEAPQPKVDPVYSQWIDVPDDNSPRFEATGFYDESLIPDTPPLAVVEHTAEQVSRERFFRVFLLRQGDLLADYCLISLRDWVTDEQIIEAKLLALQYDSRLKDLRREYAKIMERAGIASTYPTQALEKIRIKSHYLLAEVRTKIVREVLTDEQRELMFEKNHPELFPMRSRLVSERRRLYDERERLIAQRVQHSAAKEWKEAQLTHKFVLENLKAIQVLEKKFTDLNAEAKRKNEARLLRKKPASER